MSGLLIVTDAWHPQVNGVVRSLDRLGQEVKKQGMEVHYLTPLDFKDGSLPDLSGNSPFFDNAARRRQKDRRD